MTLPSLSDSTKVGGFRNNLLDPPRAARLGYWRLLPAALLLLGETLLLALLFDSGDISEDGPWWLKLVTEAPAMVRIMLASAAAALAIFRLPVLETPPVSKAAPRNLAELSLAVGTHFLAFALLLESTRRILPGHRVTTQPEPTIVALWVGAGLLYVLTALLLIFSASALAAFARRYHRILFAALTVGACTWLIGNLLLVFWEPLTYLTFQAVKFVLTLLTPEVTVQVADQIIGTPNFLVQIAPACSGLEGMGLVFVFLSAYLWVFRHGLKFPLALWILPLGILLSWLANILRIVGLILVGTHISPKLAVGGFHSHSGWLAFLAISIGIIASIRHLRLVQPNQRLSSLPPNVGSAPYLAPILVFLAIGLLTGIFRDGGFYPLYPIRVLAALGLLWCYRNTYRTELAGAWTWQALGLGILAFLIWIAIGTFQGQVPHASSLSATLLALDPTSRASWIGFRLLGFLLIAPVVEELAFRGYLPLRLLTHDFQSLPAGHFTWKTLLITSLLFGLVHSRFVSATLVGLLYALAYARRGRLGEAVVAHATTNALLVVQAISLGDWSVLS